MNEDQKIVPIVREPLSLDGISLNSALKGDNVSISVKGSLTSFDVGFHEVSSHLCHVLSILPAWRLLVKWNEVETHIFIDNFPMMLNVRINKSIQKGEHLYKNDIADVSTLSFGDQSNNLNPKKGEKVIAIISAEYLHGLYYDFTGELDPGEFIFNMGSLYKQIHYPHIYRSFEDDTIVKMIEKGWFPFVGLVDDENKLLMAIFKEGKADRVSDWCEDTFDHARIDKMVQRWLGYAAYQSKKTQFEQGLKCVKDGNYIAAILTLNPLVEGVFNEYLMQKTGKGISYKGNQIAESIYKKAVERLGENSLLLPKHFRDYLLKYFFKHNTSPVSDDVTRNASAHGRSKDAAFDFEKALIVIMTLDQLFFFMDRN